MMVSPAINSVAKLEFLFAVDFKMLGYGLLSLPKRFQLISFVVQTHGTPDEHLSWRWGIFILKVAAHYSTLGLVQLKEGTENFFPHDGLRVKYILVMTS